MSKSPVRNLLLAMILAAATVFAGCTDTADDALGGASTAALEQTTGTLDDVAPELECSVAEMGGKCRGMSTWETAAAKRCTSKGLELTEIHAVAECGNGRASAISYTCCKPNPDPCVNITRTTKTCKTESAWLTTAMKTCSAKGMILSDFAVSGPCGKNRWHTANFRCCPDKDICCATTAGPQMTPASKCPAGSALQPEMCKIQEICCKLPDGTLVVTSSNKCKANGGTSAPLDMCYQEVCCKTSSGYQIVPANHCKGPNIVSMDLCKPVDVCCKLDGGFFTVPSTQCPTGQVVSDEMCKPIEVCCKLQDGTLVILTADECKLKGGLAGAIDLCDPKVCCETAAGYQIVPASQCPNAQVPMELCAPQEVCCKLPDGTFATLSSADCEAKGGSVAPIDLCAPPADICCVLPDGTVMILSADKCKAGGGIQTAMEKCDPTVCCETAAGYQMVPASQCPAGAIVSNDLCKPQDVCCKTGAGFVIVPSTQCPATQVVSMELCAPPADICCVLPDGTVMILSADKCKAGGGIQTAMEKCDPTVCCETAAGYQMVPASQCPAGAIVSNDLCKPTEVCCKLSDGTFIITVSTQCPASQIVSFEMCKPADDICCLLPDGTVTFLTADQCKQKGGIPTSLSDCDPTATVCCETSSGYQLVPASQCPNAQVPLELCQPTEVCCKLSDGTFIITPSTQCPASQIVSFEMCKPTEVCCKLSDGTFAFALSTQCPASQVVAIEMCQPSEKVCCLLPDGTVATLSIDDCKLKGGTPTSLSDCDPTVCCETPIGYMMVPASQCPGAQVPAELCQPTEVCCKLDGGFIIVPSTQCPTGQVVSMEMCHPVEIICCLLPDGTVANMSADDCKLKGGTLTTMSDCDPTVCCETPDGYQILPATQCPGAVVPMDLCKPTEVCCLIGGAAMVVPSTQCPTSQIVPMDECKYTPCDLAIFGQCKGFDYTAQCDPKGFDCGPLGILGDLDCDGQYEVCIACPPGTHPVDADGDGCEEMCDCCEPIVCPAGLAPADTNGDGCPDTCEIALCDLAITGQCKGFDYTAQCDPTGFDCTSFAILGDTDCDGKYDVCMECPAGTVPMDLDGDGCEEVCNCPTDPIMN